MEAYWQLLSWGDEGWGDEFFFGFLMTLQISLAAFFVSFLFGLAAALSKISKSKICKWVAEIYTTIVRSLPELLVVLLLYFAVAASMERFLQSTGLVGANFQFSAFWSAVVALAFVNGAFMTEVLRAAYLAVPAGQIEAALSVGMRSRLIFIRIIFPQMMRHAMPGIGNLWLSITKESAIISVLGSFQELLYTGYRAASFTRQYIFFYGFTALLFLLITLISVFVLGRFDKKLGQGM